MRRAALRKRNFVICTLSNLLRRAVHNMRPMDARTVRRINWLILAIIVAGSLRLNLLLQAVPYGQANSVKTSLSLFLAELGAIRPLPLPGSGATSRP